MRFLNNGTVPLGALLAGALGTNLGLRPTSGSCSNRPDPGTLVLSTGPIRPLVIFRLQHLNSEVEVDQRRPRIGRHQPGGRPGLLEAPAAAACSIHRDRLGGLRAQPYHHATTRFAHRRCPSPHRCSHLGDCDGHRSVVSPLAKETSRNHHRRAVSGSGAILWRSGRTYGCGERDCRRWLTTRGHEE